MNRARLMTLTAELQSVVEACGFELLDVEFVKEHGDRILRFFIYRPEGITVDDCQMVSEQLSNRLDELDPIDEHYLLEVSSPDLSRPLTTKRMLEIHLGEELEFRLYQKISGSQVIYGVLESFDEATYHVQTEKETLHLQRSQVAQVKPVIHF